VAGLARLVAGVVNRPRGHFADGCAPIMPVLAETLGDNQVPHCQEHHEGNDKQKSESKEMPGIFEGVHCEKPAGTAEILRRPIDRRTKIVPYVTTDTSLQCRRSRVP